ncbi:VF_A0006 family four-cysteine protein [Burkholderia sp. AW49-1]
MNKTSILSRTLPAILLFTNFPASAFNEDANYNQCVLTALRGSQNSSTASIMRNSCDQLHRNWQMMLPRDKAFHMCILNSLGGVRDDFAVQELVRGCSRQGENAGPVFK